MIIRKIYYLFLVLLLSPNLVFAGIDDKIPVKVRVFHDLSEIKLGITSQFEIYLYPQKIKILDGYFLKIAPIKVVNNRGIIFGDKFYLCKEIYISSKNNGALTVNGRKFRNDIRIRIINNKFEVINILSLKNYLQGVLCREIAPSWGKEALKAQAIISRTYALYKMNSSVEQEYHLSSDVYSQVYGGLYSEDIRTNQAIEDTDGLVIENDSNIIPAYFHASCGGHTENIKEIWSLKSDVLSDKECSFCKDSPYFNWTAIIKKTDISSLNILSKSESGRVTWMEVIDNKGVSTKMSGNTFRLTVGPDILKSTMFDFEIRDKDILFKGNGWGHGVGLCQWGAKEMAEKHKMSAEEILKYYYRDVELVRLGVKS